MYMPHARMGIPHYCVGIPDCAILFFCFDGGTKLFEYNTDWQFVDNYGASTMEYL